MIPQKNYITDSSSHSSQNKQAEPGNKAAEIAWSVRDTYTTTTTTIREFHLPELKDQKQREENIYVNEAARIRDLETHLRKNPFHQKLLPVRSQFSSTIARTPLRHDKDLPFGHGSVDGHPMLNNSLYYLGSGGGEDVDAPSRKAQRGAVGEYGGCPGRCEYDEEIHREGDRKVSSPRGGFSSSFGRSSASPPTGNARQKRKKY